MKKHFLLLLFILAWVLIFVAGCVKSENVSFSVIGKVVAYGEGLEDVEIIINGNEAGTNAKTDADGFFNLSGLSKGDIISFSKERYAISNYEVQENISNLIIVADLLTSVSIIYDSSEGSVSGAGDYIKNASVTLTAAPDYGYSFNGYYSGDVLLSDNSSYTFTITEDIEISARFDEITGTVSVLSDYPELISGGGDYRIGTDATLTAAENNTASFDGWYIDCILVSTGLSYSFTVYEAVTVTAEFNAVLPSPVITLNGTVLSWPAVTNAQSYNIYINGSIVSSSALLSCDILPYLTVSGNYEISAEAVSTDDGIENSTFSSIIYTYWAKIPTPYNVGVINDDLILLSFTRINSAVDYEIKINGGNYLLSEYDEFSVYYSNSVHFYLNDLLTAPGEYVFTVTAIAENASQNSLPSADYIYNYYGNLTAPEFILTDDIITWEAQQNCTKYELIINDIVVYTTTDTFGYSVGELSAGSYEVSLRVSANGYISDEYTDIINKN